MRPKGSPKTPGSGRKKGTPNKLTKSVEEICAEYGFNPIEAMIKLYHDHTIDKILQFNIAKEVAQYILPKRKALEVSSSVDLTLIDRVKEIEALPVEEIAKLAGRKDDK